MGKKKPPPPIPKVAMGPSMFEDCRPVEKQHVSLQGIMLDSRGLDNANTITIDVSAAELMAKKLSTPPPQPTPVERGQKISYEAIKLEEPPLGRGAFGQVHRALIEVGGITKKVAVKVIRCKGESDVRSLQMELESLVPKKGDDLAKKSRQYVVKGYNAFYIHHKQEAWMVMEYMDIGSLRNIMTRSRILPDKIIASISKQCLCGLVWLQRMNKLHRDIKPENILVNHKGEVKLSDFGLAQMQQSKGGCYTFCGTTEYMSPERFTSESYSFEVDVWSLGVVLGECAVGRNPVSVGNVCFFDLKERLEMGYDYTEVTNEKLRAFLSRFLLPPRDRPTASVLLEDDFIKFYFNKASEKTQLTPQEVMKHWIKDTARSPPPAPAPVPA